MEHQLISKNDFFLSLSFYKDINKCSAEWNFCESYHGKGPHDGIGALIKWNVYRRVLQGRATVKSAKDLKVAQDICSGKPHSFMSQLLKLRNKNPSINNYGTNV